MNPENALERTNKKFIKRFEYLEAKAKRFKQSFKDMTLSEMDVFWEEAKKELIFRFKSPKANLQRIYYRWQPSRLVVIKI